MATRTWIGAAADVTQVNTITIALAWATNDTVTVTINGKIWTLTVLEAAPTTSSVAQLIKKAWNGETLNATTQASTNFVAQDHGEFAEIVATVSGAVVTLTARTAGKPFTAAVGETTAGTGTATGAVATAATGKNFWDNVDNWKENAVPIDADDVVYDQGNVSCLYNLATGIDPQSVRITMGYTGDIGLSVVNTDDPQKPYSEYRQRNLQWEVNATVAPVYHIGNGEGSGSRRIYMDFNDQVAANVYVYNSAASTSTEPTIIFAGGPNDQAYYVQKGSVGFGIYEDVQIGTLEVTYRNNVQNDANVVIGKNALVAVSTTIRQRGGTITSWTPDVSSIASYTQEAGVANWYSGTMTALTVNGTFNYAAATTITTLTIENDGLFSVDQSLLTSGQALTNVIIYGNGRLVDSGRRMTYTNGVDCYGTNHDNIDWGTHYTVTPSNI